MRKAAVPLIIGLVVLGGVFWFMQKDKTANAPAATNTTQTTTPATSSDTSTTETASAQTITYANSGFSPATITVKVGEEITVVNNSGNDLDFASDDHPTHTKESEMNIGVVSEGGSKTFSISKTGTWGYHNHDNASHTGTIVVQ